MISIIDYGMGNIGSLENMIRKVNGTTRITRNRDEIESSDKIILPGVGAFDQAMTRLRELDLVEAINYAVIERKTPILCICLGAQLITESSEEGKLPGLGWIRGKTVLFNIAPSEGLRIPHMGWNDVKIKKESVLFKEMPDNSSFYFVHSYHMKLENERDILTSTFYGYEFTSAVEHENIFATQFHPEKSHKFGIRLMKNFLEL